MFAVVQFPLADSRRFLSAETQQLKVPTWAVGQVDEEFIRSSGPLKRRRRGGLADWAGEEIYCDAKHALHFPPPFIKFKGFDDRLVCDQLCIFRRYMSDAPALSRVEVGLAYRLQKGNIVSEEMCTAGITSILTQLVEIPIDGGNTVRELVKAGSSLASHYLKSSTKRNGQQPNVEKWWLSSCRPVLIFEYLLGKEMVSHPAIAKPIEHKILADAKITLSFLTRTILGKEMPIWFLGSAASGANKDTLRRLRLNLLRLHAERQCLKQVLSNINQGRIAISRGSQQSELIQEYLASASSLLLKESSYGIPQSEIRIFADQLEEIVSEGERTSMIRSLESVRKNVQKTVYKLAGIDLSSLDLTKTPLVVIEHAHVEGPMQQNIQINNSTLRDLNVVVARSIENSFNAVEQSDTPVELKTKLKEMVVAVTEMSKHLPEPQQDKLAHDLKTLTTEAASKTPRREWYEFSANGIIEAAKTVGDIATPVIAAVKAVLALVAT